MSDEGAAGAAASGPAQAASEAKIANAPASAAAFRIDLIRILPWADMAPPLLVQSDDEVVRYIWFTWRLEIETEVVRR